MDSTSKLGVGLGFFGALLCAQLPLKQNSFQMGWIKAELHSESEVGISSYAAAIR
jgi:hypothetical protein